MQHQLFNAHSALVTVGASHNAVDTRESDDFYSTDPAAVRALIRTLDSLQIAIPQTIIEPSVGAGHIAQEFVRIGRTVEAYDIHDRGWKGTQVLDYLSLDAHKAQDAMTVGNPPFFAAVGFVRKSLTLHRWGQYICYLLWLLFLESKGRRSLFDEHPPRYVCVFSERTNCLHSGRTVSGGAMCYAWFIWQVGYTGRPEIVWI